MSAHHNGPGAKCYRAPVFSRRLPAEFSPNDWSRTLERRKQLGARVLDLTDQNPTRLGLGDDPGVREALADAGGPGYDPVACGLPEAREAVAGYYAGRGLRVDPADLVLCSGTSEAYSQLFRMVCDPGDGVLAPAPGYPLFGPLAALDALELTSYPLMPDEHWRPDLAALEAALDERTRVVITVQPNHPTGSCFDVGEAAALDALCARRGVAVISDEVFGDFLWGREPVGARPSLLGEREAATFALQGLSKLCGLPQLKLSWIAIAGPDALRSRARESLEWIADAYLTVGTPVQRALPRLLESRHGFRERVLERVAANRAALDAALGTCGARALPGEGGWSAVVRLPQGVEAEALALAMLERDVVVHPGHFYDFDDDAHLVLSLIVAPAVMAGGAARLAATVRER